MLSPVSIQHRRLRCRGGKRHRCGRGRIRTGQPGMLVAQRALGAIDAAVLIPIHPHRAQSTHTMRAGPVHTDDDDTAADADAATDCGGIPLRKIVTIESTRAFHSALGM